MEFFLDTKKHQATFNEKWLHALPGSVALLFATVAIIFIKIGFKSFKICIPSNGTFLHKTYLESEARFIPSLPSISGLGPLYPLLWKDFGKLFTSWMSNYGTTFRLKLLRRNVVFLSNPKYIQKLVTSTDPGHLLKYPAIYHVLFPGSMKTGMIATSNIPDWKHNRSIFSEAFSPESLKAYIKVFNRHAKTLIIDMREELNDKTQKHENDTKSLHAMLRESTFNSTADIIIGADTLSEEDKLMVHDKFVRGQEIISYRFYHPWCLIDIIWKFHSQKREMDGLIDCLTKNFAKVIKHGREKLNEEKSVKSFIDYMDAAGLNSTQIFAELSNSLSAGYDTMRIGLYYFLFNMALHPKYQDECRKEIDEVFHSLNGSDDQVNGDVTFDALADMKYLEMCIKESLRIFTPVPVILRELGASLNLYANVVLAKGTLVFVSPGLIHRDPSIYPDPVTYDPDRFLLENCRARSAYSFLAFSAGPRNCIGWKLAMIQIKLLASYILRHYEVYTENSYENLNKVWNKSIWPTKDLGVRWRIRKQNI